MSNAPFAETAQTQQLRRQIGWLCHVVRLLAATYALWILAVVVIHWSNVDTIARVYANWLKKDVSGLSVWQQLAGFGVSMTLWAFAAAACYSAWRLFSGYLEGRIFTVDAAIWLRRIGTFGLMASLGDILARPLVSAIVSLHLPAGQRTMAVAFNPNDLLFALFLSGFIALAHIFKVAAEIADDNARFV